MKPGTNQRRSRGRSSGGGNNPNSGGNSGGGNSGGGGNRRGNRNQSYDSNGPDVKVRGTAQQVLDKYLQLARDSQSGGDRVKAEAYLQFAEHYYRIVNAEQEGSDRPQRTEQSDQSAQGGEQPRQNDQPRQDERPERPERTERAERPERADRPQVQTIAIEQPQGEEGEAPAKEQADRPPRARRRTAHVKNEATLAAEAAAANEARTTRGRNRPRDEDIGEAIVESTVPAPTPRSDDDDDLDAAANG